MGCWGKIIFSWSLPATFLRIFSFSGVKLLRIYLTDSTFQISCQNFFLACGKARSWVIGGFLLIFADFFTFLPLFLDFGIHIPFQGLKTIKSNEVQQFQVFSAVNMKFWLLSYPKKAEKWPKIDILAFSRFITAVLRSATCQICVNMGFYWFEIINSNLMMLCRLVIPLSPRLKPPKHPLKSKFWLKFLHFSAISSHFEPKWRH